MLDSCSESLNRFAQQGLSTINVVASDIVPLSKVIIVITQQHQIIKLGAGNSIGSCASNVRYAI